LGWWFSWHHEDQGHLHPFHFHCIQRALKERPDSLCPVCRADISPLPLCWCPSEFCYRLLPSPEQCAQIGKIARCALPVLASIGGGWIFGSHFQDRGSLGEILGAGILLGACTSAMWMSRSWENWYQAQGYGLGVIAAGACSAIAGIIYTSKE
jgi:hypothetical protein